MTALAHRTAVASALLLALAFAPSALAADPDPKDWPAVVAAAKGQTVTFHASGGEPRVNAYIAWAGNEVERRFGVKVVHVEPTDTAEAVQRVLADKTAGADAGGAVDLIWINGDDFAAMKSNGLLFGPWAASIPNYRLTSLAKNEHGSSDFTVAVDGLESPWGRVQLVFYHDLNLLTIPPKSMASLLAWSRANPGRFAYPRPPDRLGLTLLRQILLELTSDTAPLYDPVAASDFEATAKPLWDYLDKLHPVLWCQGKDFPANATELRRLFADKQTRLGFTLDPGDVSAAIASAEFSPTVETYVLSRGTIGHVHFLAIPFNASNKAGAMVLADFLLSPPAQAKKLDPAVWGDQTVIDVSALRAEDRALFDAVDVGSATLRPERLGTPRADLHPSWNEAISKAWLDRYGTP